MARSRIAGAAATVLVLPFLSVVAQASPAPAQPAAAPAAGQQSDTRDLTRKDFTLDGRPVETPHQYHPRADARNRAQAAAETPPVGTVRQWLGLDDARGALYRKDYTLRGVGDNIEVWVANDIAFPAGDCRLQVPSNGSV